MEDFNLIVAQQPQWIQIWLNILSFGAFLLPISLLIWRQSRVASIITLISSMLAAAGVIFIFNQLGYVRLMGLGHIIPWTPLAFYLWYQQARADMPEPPRRIIRFILLTITISLVFDYADVVRYLLGERAAFTAPA
ncbi:hypothetical protein [Ruegeria profundi]|uniref:hypothetical protein n=1 Tax=Ruegeria profundi TaxID=1685378 RepID=UPI001CD62487|nr:hypothetical protein [Ruegeria profundi]MCA0927824.1 hypothetical protein [Ruegeria profundi]